MAFRLTPNSPSIELNWRRLGDRDLTLWLGRGAGGIYHYSTYSYTNLNGAGRSNWPQNVRHFGRHVKWHYVYFGYSKTDKKAFAYVKFHDKEESRVWNNVNHYYAEKFLLYVAKDRHYNAYNGEVAYFNYVSGEGAFRDKPNFD